MGRIDNELEHSRRIAPQAERIWGWATPAGKLRLERRAQYVVTLGQFTAEDSLLEIGCGTGLLTEHMVRRTRATIIATDLSTDLLAEAKRRVPDVAFQLANAMALRFEDNQFDGVYGNSILHHLEMAPALGEIHRVLKHGRALVLAEPNMLNPQIMVQKHVPWIKAYVGDSPDETAIVRWHVARLMRTIGFQQVRIFPFDFLHPLTPWFLIRSMQRIGSVCERVPLLREIAGSVVIYGRK